VPKKIVNNILYISTFPPRECGLATFTKDLTDALDKKFNPAVKTKILAINNERTDIYNYDSNVMGQIAATDIEDYIISANKINQDSKVKLIHVQHEFGIFGGENGNHLIPLFQVIKKPVIITFHSVNPKPTRNLKHVVQFITKNVKAVIVMNELSKEILEKEYEIEKSKVFIIPHGIPQITFSNGEKEKEELGIKGKNVLTTFGFLSRGKGIEYAIRALPAIVRRFPNTLYLIIGATHPIVRKFEGESYRNFLKKEVEQLKLKNHVKFYNKYLNLAEIISYLKATDIYISSSINMNQSVSGTLSYALGCGRPVISTASSYAKSIITPGKGILVKPKDSKAITKALLLLLKDPAYRKQIAHNAYIETRHMLWPNVALAHFDLYQKYISLSPEEKLPPIHLKHLSTLTDTFGIIQFAKHTKPDKRYGYCIDDNSRALIVAAKYWAHSNDKQAIGLLQTYLSFVKFAQKPNGKFANFITSKKTIKEINISEDSIGRVTWALGYLISQTVLPQHIRNQAEKIFRKTVPALETLKSTRAIAFAIIGLYFYKQTYPSHYKDIFEKLRDSQINRFLQTASKEWGWFEDFLTYSNSKIPESLFYAYLITGKKICLDIAEKSLNFLIGITFNKDYFSPIGQEGWYFRFGKRAYFDQQPEDTSSMVQTLVVAYQITKREIYKNYALQAFQWFLGKNHLKQVVYDEVTGGCYDGLGRYSLNINQGAESTISYLLARLAIEEI
jgi:glycosyltransferase involved in cell wall biosynthesis